MLGAEEGYGVAVLDASVAVRWLVNEVGSDQAEALLTREIRWLAPRLILTEVASALRRKVAGAELASEGAIARIQGLLDMVTTGVLRLSPDEQIVASALTLSFSVGHKLPDCMYLALAEREGTAIVSADARLCRIAAARGIPTIEIGSA